MGGGEVAGVRALSHTSHKGVDCERMCAADNCEYASCLWCVFVCAYRYMCAALCQVCVCVCLCIFSCVGVDPNTCGDHVFTPQVDDTRIVCFFPQRQHRAVFLTSALMRNQ